MFGIVFTLDYEIHGNGDGSPYDLIIEPTSRLLNLFNSYDAKVTIMADVAEIIKFEEYFEKHKRDDFYFEKIKEQLGTTLINGHDVQLHIHSSYFNAKYKQRKWHQDWDEYNLAELDITRMKFIIKTCKEYLENLLRPFKMDYSCNVFRSANWSVMPSKNIIRALIENNIKIDTSVFKYGKRNDRIKFDYSDAYHNLLPWPVDEDDVCKKFEKSEIFEFPIYSELKSVPNFLTLNRLYRLFQSFKHKHERVASTNGTFQNKNFNLNKALAFLFIKHAWKMDFNQCSANQLINTLKQIEKKNEFGNLNLPIVLIGHSKLFSRRNEKNLMKFLKFIKENNKKYYFAKFSDFDLNTFI